MKPDPAIQSNVGPLETWNSEPTKPSYPSKVESAGVSILWFPVSTYCLKTYTKCCTNNLLLHVTNNFLLTFFWWITSFWFQSFEKTFFFWILLKSLHKTLYKQQCKIKCRKTFLACILQSIKYFQNPFQQKHWIEKMAIKSRFLFCSAFVYCWLCSVSILAASCFNHLGPFK